MPIRWKDWIKIGFYLKTNRKVYFTELSPGNYVFKVKASGSNGLWNKQETTLAIQILPPWWTSSWVYFLYITLGILITTYLIRNYHRKVEEKNRRKIELLETAKEKEIFEAKIEFFTNIAHENKNPVNAY